MPENRPDLPPAAPVGVGTQPPLEWAEIIGEVPVVCHAGPGQTGFLWQAVQGKADRYASPSGVPFLACLPAKHVDGVEGEVFPAPDSGDVVALRYNAAGQASVVDVHLRKDEAPEAKPDHPPAAPVNTPPPGAAIGEWAQVIGLPIICCGGPEQIPLTWVPCRPVADAYSEPSGAPFFALIPPRAGSIPCVDITDTLVLLRDANGQAVALNAAYLAVDEAIEEPFEEAAPADPAVR